MDATCPQTLGPGLAALSAAIEAGQVFTDKVFAAYCVRCPDTLTDAAKDSLVKVIDNKALCQIICCCKDTGYRQVCVQETLDAADDLLQGSSRYKAEISYNMTAEPVPLPFMHRDAFGNDTTRRSARWQTRAQNEITGYTRGNDLVRRPDVVIVNDTNMPPTQDNIVRIVEMKFTGDRPGPGQYDDYAEIAGGRNKLVVLEEEQCGCNDEDGDRLPDPIPIVVPERQTDTDEEPAWWEVPVWGVATAALAVATLALAIFPLDGPAGEAAAGAGTVAAAARFAQAWGAAFAAP